MSDEPFGRQLKPVTVIIEGEEIDRDYWSRQLRMLLAHRNCVTNSAQSFYSGQSSFRINPGANND